MLQRATFFACLSWLLAALVLPMVATADGPAVKALNGSAHVRYASENTGFGSDDESLTTLFGQSDGAWNLGGVVTTPVYFPWLGGRFAVEGGGRTIESKSATGATVSTVDGGQVDLLAQLFLRNPELGHLDIGYRFGWESFSGSSVERYTTNGIAFDGGFYIPDNGAGAIDWDFFFSWGHGRERSTSQEDAISEYTAGAVIGWYFMPTLRLSGGFRWERRDPELSLVTQELGGTGELAWLLPIGERRNVTLRVFGGGGNLESQLAPPSSSIDQTVYSVGVGLSFSYPGASTLVELVREFN